MQQHYVAAERFQSSGDLEQAAFQYQLFLTDALRHIANDRASIGEYAQAVPVFDQAMKLAPNDFNLRLDYTQAALAAKDFPKAQQLAQALLASHAPDLERAKIAKLHWLLGQAHMGIKATTQARMNFQQLSLSIQPTRMDTPWPLRVLHCRIRNVPPGSSRKC